MRSSSSASSGCVGEVGGQEGVDLLVGEPRARVEARQVLPLARRTCRSPRAARALPCRAPLPRSASRPAARAGSPPRPPRAAGAPARCGRRPGAASPQRRGARRPRAATTSPSSWRNFSTRTVAIRPSYATSLPICSNAITSSLLLFRDQSGPAALRLRARRGRSHGPPRTSAPSFHPAGRSRGMPSHSRGHVQADTLVPAAGDGASERGTRRQGEALGNGHPHGAQQHAQHGVGVVAQAAVAARASRRSTAAAPARRRIRATAPRGRWRAPPGRRGRARRPSREFPGLGPRTRNPSPCAVPRRALPRR